MKKRIILIGKAGSGKDYFRDYLSLSEQLDVSYTTRPARKGEREGYTYNYITEEQFIEMKKDDKFFEAVNFNGWWYGTSQENWDTKNIFIMTPSGTEHIPEDQLKECVLVYFDIPIDVRRERLALRSDADSVERRIAADERDFEGFNKFDIRITNPLYDTEKLKILISEYSRL